MSPVSSPPRNRADERRRSQDKRRSRDFPDDVSALDAEFGFVPNPLFAGLSASLEGLSELDDSLVQEFGASLMEHKHSPSSDALAAQTKSSVSPGPSSGAPSNPRRRPSSEPDTSRNVVNAQKAHSPSPFGDVPSAPNAFHPLAGRPNATPSDGSGSESITIMTHSRPVRGRPSPPSSAPAGPSNAFDVSYNGYLPQAQFNLAHPGHHHPQQQQQWVHPSQQPSEASAPFDPSQHVISFAPGSPPYSDQQIHHRRQMIRGAVIQGMQAARTQSQGPLHISTPNGNNFAHTALQTHSTLSVSPSYTPEFSFPANNRDSGGVHAASDGTSLMGGLGASGGGGMPPSASSSSPSPSFSSSSLSTPVVYNGPSPNFLHNASAPGTVAGGGSSAGAPPPTIHHPNPHKISQSSLRSSSRPSPTLESSASRDSGHPYASTNRHGGRTRRNPSDPNQLQSGQQHAVGGVAPDINLYGQRRTSCGPIPGPPRMTARRSGMSPPNGVLRGQRHEENGNLMPAGPVPLLDQTTSQAVQYANVQHWAHGVGGPQVDRNFNSPPSAGGVEYPRVVNRASSSASLTASSDSSLAWGSTDDLRFNPHTVDMQSPIGEGEVWQQQWQPPTTVDPSAMMAPPLNTPFDPTFPGIQDGHQYSPVVGPMTENYYQAGLVLNGTGQSPKPFGQTNGMVVSPASGIQAPPVVWNQHSLPPSMGHGLQQQ